MNTAQQQLPFSVPVIDTAKNDPTKRWQVRYSYLDENGKRITVRITKGLHSSKLSFNEKMKIAVALRDQSYRELILGKTDAGQFDLPNHLQPIFYTLEIIKAHKQRIVSPNTWKPYVSNIKHFSNFLHEHGLSSFSANELEAKHIYMFIDWLQVRNVKNRTLNNILVDVRSTWEQMIKLGFCKYNICAYVEKLPAKSTRNRVYSKTDVKRIKNWCEKNDPYLYLFCKFVMMGIRPQAAVQIQIKDIDVEEYKIILPAEIEKTNKRTVKVIFERFRREFMEMELWSYPANYYFFTCQEQPGKKPTTRDWFTRKFQKLKKELGLGNDYTLYGWKHTIAVELFKNGTDIRDIMAITGHSTLSGFEAYIREYLDAKPSDPSGKINLEI